MDALLAKLDFLPGKKTTIVVTLAGLLWIAGQLGFVTPDLVDQGLVALGILGGGTMAAKMNRLRGPVALWCLGMLIPLSMFANGCTTTHFDGAGAAQVAAVQLVSTRTLQAGAASPPIIAADCEPFEAFARRMGDERGAEKVRQWMWSDGPTLAERLAAQANVQRILCEEAARRGIDGAAAERARQAFERFWRAGAVLQPVPE